MTDRQPHLQLSSKTPPVLNVTPCGSILRRRGPGQVPDKEFGTGNGTRPLGKFPFKRDLGKTGCFTGDINLHFSGLRKCAKNAQPAVSPGNPGPPNARCERKFYPDHEDLKPKDRIWEKLGSFSTRMALWAVETSPGWQGDVSRTINSPSEGRLGSGVGMGECMTGTGRVWKFAGVDTDLPLVECCSRGIFLFIDEDRRPVFLEWFPIAFMIAVAISQPGSGCKMKIADRLCDRKRFPISVKKTGIRFHAHRIYAA